MAGRRSPWGGGDKGGEQPGDDAGDGEEAHGGDGSGGGSSEPPKGPRNPWLPPGDTPPRRSATIEDIFRSKAGRKPGGGGGLPRLPQRQKLLRPPRLQPTMPAWCMKTAWPHSSSPPVKTMLPKVRKPLWPM